MKPSSPSSSSSSPSAPKTQLLSSSSSPYMSLQSPELQAAFLQECRRRFQPHDDVAESNVTSSATSPPFSPSPPPFSPSSPLPSPFSPTPLSSPSSSSSSPCSARLSLSSPELLSELKDSRTRPLRHVPAHNGLTTIFSGRGRGGGQAPGPVPYKQQANQKPSQ